jgi:hypothetical protein
VTGPIPAALLCCDPGLASGLGILTYDPIAGIQKAISLEGTLPEVGQEARSFLTLYSPASAEVVCERFTITVQTAKNSQAPWSLEVIGMLKWLVADVWHVDPEEKVILQQPADAKGLVPNPLLRSMGLWHRGGAGHANDALRHGVYRYARLGVRGMFT